MTPKERSIIYHLVILPFQWSVLGEKFQKTKINVLGLRILRGTILPSHVYLACRFATEGSYGKLTIFKTKNSF